MGNRFYFENSLSLRKPSVVSSWFLLFWRPTSWFSPVNDECLSSSQEPATWCTNWWRRRILRRNDVSAASSLRPVLNLPLRVSCHARAFVFMYMGSIFISCTLSLSDNLRINKNKNTSPDQNLPLAPLDVWRSVTSKSQRFFVFTGKPGGYSGTQRFH